MSAAIQVRFSRVVRLRVDRGFLACAGPLMARARVTACFVGDRQLIGRSPAASLSSAPEWNWETTVVIPAFNPVSTIVLDINDVLTGQFLGTAQIDLCVTNGQASSFQVMLEPRRSRDDMDVDPRDADTMQVFKVDDFGYVTGTVSVVAIACTPEAEQSTPRAAPLARFPIGCCLRATLLASRQSSQDANARVFATFGTAPGEFPLALTPLALSIGCQQDCAISFRCVLPGNLEGRAFLNVPVHALSAVVEVALPVTRSGDPADGSAIAVLVVCITALANPSFPTDSGSQGTKLDFHRAPPDVPAGLFHAPAWESESHIARATERRWRRSIATEAVPQKDHLRHLHDVIAGRCELSTSMIPLVRSFFNIAPTGATATVDLRQLLCSLSFACQGITPCEAALFVFESVAMRLSTGELVVGQPELCFILEHGLLPKTLDMSVPDIKQRCTDLMLLWSSEGMRTESGALLFSLNAYANMIAGNAGLWATCGAALEGVRPSAADVPVEVPSDGNWRHMIIRVPATKRGFAVTAHAEDTFRRVAKQIEEAVGISAAKQTMIMDRTVVDFDTRVGALISPSSQATTEIIVAEADESIKLCLVYRAKNLKWDVPVTPAEKVLKLRAQVQQKTNIPLSRVTLTLGGVALSDRHPLSHYGVFDGVVIDVASTA